MKKPLVLSMIVIAALATSASAATNYLFFKSPAAGMHFTAGLTVQVWGDLIPRDDAVGWPAVECHWDDQMVDKRVGGNPKGYDYYPFTVPAELVTPGVHKLKLSGFVRGGGPSTPPDVTLSVQVDPWPADKKVVELKEDLTAADLDWTNVAVKGNGHVVKVSGKLTIKNSLVTGLGSMKIENPATVDTAKDVVMVPGITGTLGGAVDIQDSIFEATGALRLTINGDGAVTINNNEFRANNFIKFVPYNPDASPVIEINGNNTAPKLFQGNRIGSGIVQFNRMSHWLIGGDTDAQSNIMIGPRCVLSIADCRDVHVIGNYIHHEYRGQWSQGFNLICSGSEVLAEHNVIRASSWPLQSFGGEFRYNLMVDSGHNWVRSMNAGTQFHHNVLVHTGDPFGSGIGAGIWLYGNKAINVAVYNNTFDAGEAPEFGAPIIALSTGCGLASFRNNVSVGVRPITGIARNALVARAKDKDDPEADSAKRVAYADYNCFFNPSAPKAANYDPGIVEKKDPGKDPGAHDVNADPKFAKGRQNPYAINEDDVWNRKFKVSQVLAYYRDRYAPSPGSPLLGAGDPADGKDSYIGAIGPGTAANDLFGRFSLSSGDKTKK